MGVLIGGPGNDFLQGDNNDDNLIGGAGDDTLLGLDGNDLLDGGADNDILAGAAGEDLLDGRAGNDLLSGGDGIDLLDGGEGNDTLIGDRGDDNINGGDGDDRVIWNNGDGSDIIEGGAGFDVVEVNGADGAGDNFALNANGPRVRFERLNLGQFNLNVNDVERFEINGLGGDDTLTVNDLSGTDAQQVVFDGGDGNDLLDGTNAVLPLFGIGGAGNDTLLGGAGNDLLRGGDGIDLLDGGEGNDTLIGDRGNDNINGGDGDDRVIWNNGDGSDVIEGGAGFDVVEVNGADGAGDNFALNANGPRVRFERLNLGQFNLDVNDVEQFEINGLGGDDTLTVNDLSGTDVELVVFNGGDGNDLLDGTNAVLPLVGIGGNGNDTLIGGAGDDNLRGDAGNDSLVGGAGDDNLIGDAGDDTLIGGDGDDNLVGGDGNDVLISGNGITTFTFDTGAAFDSSDLGLDSILNFVGSQDRISLEQSTFNALTGTSSGGLASSEWAVVDDNSEVESSDALIVYNSETGALFYNQNGSEAGLGSGAQFAAIDIDTATTLDVTSSSLLNFTDFEIV